MTELCCEYLSVLCILLYELRAEYVISVIIITLAITFSSFNILQIKIVFLFLDCKGTSSIDNKTPLKASKRAAKDRSVKKCHQKVRTY